MIALRLVHSAPIIHPAHFEGTAEGVGVLVGQTNLITGLSGDFVGFATVEGTVERLGSFAGLSSGSGQLLGALDFAQALTGTASGVGAMQGLLEGLGALEGHIAGVGQIVGAVTASQSVSGSMSGVGVLTGAVTFATSGQATGLLLAITRA